MIENKFVASSWAEPSLLYWNELWLPCILDSAFLLIQLCMLHTNNCILFLFYFDTVYICLIFYVGAVCPSPSNSSTYSVVSRHITVYSVGDEAIYKCNSNLIISGTLARTALVVQCLATGKWSLAPPFCVGKFLIGCLELAGKDSDHKIQVT